MTNFLEELFNPDHFDNSGGGTQSVHCILMQPGKPESFVLTLLNDPNYTGKLQYLEGSSLLDQDLDRCSLINADAIVLLGDKFSYDAEQEDTHTILQAMIIKNYLS